MAEIRLLCVNPPSPPGTVANREGAGGMGVVTEGDDGFFYPPHALAWAAAAARAEGLAVTLLDAVAERLDAAAALDRIAAEAPQVVAVQCSPATGASDAAFLAALGRRLPAARRIAFGVAVEWIEADLTVVADLVLAGEPEGALAAATRSLLEARGVKGTRRPGELGAQGYDASGHFFNFDSLPIPAWDLLPRDRYSMYTVYAGRGCSYHCGYCPYVVAQGRTHRPRLPSSVAAEFETLLTRFGARRIVFRDPLFASDPAATLTLCQEIHQRCSQYSVRWECETRPEQLTPDLLRAMRDAGCSTVKLGVETVAPDALVATGRVTDIEAAGGYVEQTRRVIAACRKLGIVCRVFVMVGLPGVAGGSKETADWLRRHRPDTVHAKPLIQYPGTSVVPAATMPVEMLQFENIDSRRHWRQNVRARGRRVLREIKALVD